MTTPPTRRFAGLALIAATVVGAGALAPPGGASGSDATASAYGAQTTVGFAGLEAPSGVAVAGAAGSTVLATTFGSVDLEASVQSIGPGAQATLGFGDLGSPYGLARDTSGNLYASDLSNHTVVELPAGGGSPVELTIDGLDSPAGIAVDAAGNVYVADSGNGRVVKEPADGGAQSDVAFTGLDTPYAVAVDASGNVFVADVANDDVKELPAGGGAQVTLGFSGLSAPDGLAVAGGTVYVADSGNDRVVTLPVAGGTQATLGFTGLDEPAGIAVSTNGSVFVADAGNDRVVSLPVPANTVKQSFVIATYTDYIQRTPTASELSSGVASISDVTVVAQRAAFAKTLANTDKYLGAFVNKLYNDTLGRDGDSGGVTYWTKKLRAKSQTPAQVSANFYASNEYFKGFGKGTNADWVKDLYQKLLLRPATSAEVTAGVNTTVAKGRYSFAYSLFQGLESRKVRVTLLYQRFLGRNPDSGGRDYWAGKVLTQGDIALAFNLSSSNEYFTKAQTRFP